MPKQISEERFNIFISYHEQIKKSLNIADELKGFFEKWGIKCELVRSSTATDVAQEQIKRLINEADFFIQLFTQSPEPTQWMRTELYLWQEKMKINQGCQSFIVYHCDETNGENNDTFKVLFMPDAQIGKIKLVNIDRKENIQQSIYDVLYGCKRIQKYHGDILFPSFCDGNRFINFREIKEFIENFSESNQDGLERVFANKVHAQQRIKKTLRHSKTINMLGITLKRYIFPGEEIGNEFIAALNNGSKAQLMFLNLDSRAAIHRASIESEASPYKESLLYTDGQMVREYYNDETIKTAKYNIETKEYEFPYMGVVLLDNEAFIEIYHTGETIKREAELCGEVPILNIRKESKFYNLFESHFNNQWIEGKKL